MKAQKFKVEFPCVGIFRKTRLTLSYIYGNSSVRELSKEILNDLFQLPKLEIIHVFFTLSSTLIDSFLHNKSLIYEDPLLLLTWIKGRKITEEFPCVSVFRKTRPTLIRIYRISSV